MIDTNQSLEEVQEKFRDFYEKELKNDIVFIERLREKYLKSLHTRSVVCVLLAIIALTGIFLLKLDIKNNFELFYLFILMFCWLQTYLHLRYLREYKSKYKNIIMNKICSFLQVFEYVKKIDKKSLKKILIESRLFDEASFFDMFCCDDFFVGKYRDAFVFIADGGYNGFRGVWILLVRNVSLSGRIIVHEKGISHSKGLTVAGRLEQTKDLIKLSSVDEVLQKNWNIYTSDQFEANYLLTPTFLERIEEIKHSFCGLGIELSFWQNKLLIAVNTVEDEFEFCSMQKSALDYDDKRKMMVQFYTILSAMDNLLGNDRT